MRRHFILASLGAITLTGSAFAADLAPPPPPPVPLFTWTGVYAGGQVGYAWDSGNLNYTGFDPVSGLGFTTGLGGSPNGVLGGAHVGYNYQLNQFVFGLEGSVDGTSITNTVTGAFPAFGGSAITASTNSDIQGSVRGRIGFAWDRALIYATGGVAFGGFNTNYAFAGNTSGIHAIDGGHSFYASNSYSNTRVGWTVGGGIDYAISNYWSVFAEYRYTDWGSISAPGLAAAGFLSAPALTSAALNVNRTLNQNQVQVGFSYKFDTFAPPPVVAKY
jgi:outer membrane immunogenic protein